MYAPPLWESNRCYSCLLRETPFWQSNRWSTSITFFFFHPPIFFHLYNKYFVGISIRFATLYQNFYTGFVLGEWVESCYWLFTCTILSYVLVHIVRYFVSCAHCKWKKKSWHFESFVFLQRSHLRLFLYFFLGSLLIFLNASYATQYSVWISVVLSSWQYSLVNRVVWKKIVRYFTVVQTYGGKKKTRRNNFLFSR